MTLFEIFLRFCKEEGVYMDIVKELNKSANNTDTEPEVKFYTLISYNGVNSIIESIYGFEWYKSYFTRLHPQFKKVVLKWKRMVSNNIFMKEFPIKSGDTVETIYGQPYIVRNIDWKANYITGVGTFDGCRINSITKLNGKNVDWMELENGMKFYMKIRKKEYHGCRK